MDPDELYTLRAQFWLGHYGLCLEEAKSIARRPMSPALKAEREEFVMRAHLAMGQYDKVIQEADGSDKAAIQALGMQARYQSSRNDEAAKESTIDGLKTLLSDPSNASSTSVQLAACNTFLQHGLTRDALKCVHLGTTMEHLAVALQIYLKIDRLDLAAEQLGLLRQADEDAILTQLGGVYLSIATGRSGAPDAVHHLGSLSEQYGPSGMLLNCMAVAQMVAGNMEAAETALVEATADHAESVDTLINTVVCYQHMGKSMAEIEPLLSRLREGYPEHPFVQGLVRVEGAFEREAVKYSVVAKA